LNWDRRSVGGFNEKVKTVYQSKSTGGGDRQRGEGKKSDRNPKGISKKRNWERDEYGERPGSSGENTAIRAPKRPQGAIF